MRIERVSARTLSAPLVDPFVIATGRLDRVENVAVRAVVRHGAEGWGEVACLRPVTAEDARVACDAVAEVAPSLVGFDAADAGALARHLEARLPGLPAVRAGIEMAVWDALARSQARPLHKLFGDAAAPVVTDITLPIAAPPRMEALAARWRAEGFDVLKIKVGIGVEEDLENLRAVRRGHPTARLVLDANEGWTAEETLRVLDVLRSEGVEPALLEQPVRREDLAGLGRLAREAGVPVAADEAVRSADEARRVAEDGLAQVVNVKLAKLGVYRALEVVEVCRRSGLGLMHGGMVESRIGMGFAAHLVSGLGGFDWIDLDTPLLFAEDPVYNGTRLRGPRWEVETVAAGHGGRPLQGATAGATPASSGGHSG